MALTYLSGARLLDEAFGAVTPTVPATFYFGLSTTSIIDAGTGYTEPTTVSSAYARVAVDNNMTTWSATTANSKTNLIQIAFPISTAAWGTITTVFISDSGTVGAGNVLYFGTLSPSKVIQTGTIVYFDPGDITVSFTNV